MKIEYVSADLLEASETVIIHGCNSRGKFASGVAGVIREKYPVAYDAYMKAHEENRLSLGHIIWARGQTKRIANAVTQKNYGRDTGIVYVDYDALRDAMRRLNKICHRSQTEFDIEKWFGEKVQRVAMPKIGAGLANGDWSVIENIIEEEAQCFTPVVYVPKG